MLGRSKPVTKQGACDEAEAGAHVVAGLGVGGGRAGDDRHAGKQVAQPPEVDVLGAKVVAPLRHAVRFVDGEQGDGGGALAVEPAQALEEAVGHEPLGGHVEQVELAAVQAAEHAARFVGVERRVVEGGPHAGGEQGVDLVLHEADQRRDDDAHAGPHDGRDLEAERLAAAGGHEHEGVAAVDQVLDDLLLVGAELAKAEDVAQHGRGGRGAGGRRGAATAAAAAGAGALELDGGWGAGDMPRA